MDEALRFLKANEVWIYLLLGLGGILYIRKFLVAWQELRTAIFGLERESAQSKVNQAASVLVLLVIMALAEFALVSFVTPMFPGASTLPTPTIDLLATATGTLAAEGEPAVAETNGTAVPLPTIQLDESSCIPGEIDIVAPRSDQVVQGEVEIRGTASIAQFGFYKVEVARREEPLWLTIQAGRNPVINDVLVATWDSSMMPPGDYILQLVIVDSQGSSLEPCRVPIQITLAP